MSEEAEGPVSAWVRSWWVTLRHGTVLTRSGRELLRNLRDDASAYVEVPRPRQCPNLTPNGAPRCEKPEDHDGDHALGRLTWPDEISWVPSWLRDEDS